MAQTLVTVLFGLSASLCWGSGDFCGGLASRHSKATSVVTIAHATGFLLMVVLAVIWREPFPTSFDLIWGVLAGLAGVIGLVAFYSALSLGRMGIIAPVSAVLTATIPVLFSAFTQVQPSPIQIAGFALALFAIVFISRPESAKGRPRGIWLALLAGCGFGTFFVLISRVHQDETFWPLAVARLTSVLFLLCMASVRRDRVRLEGRSVVPPLVLLAGILDAIGNAFFVLAAHSGRLDIASILSSLYPAATVLLAALVLRERVTRIQTFGILLALLAIPLISA
jgi:uncharacterized membrane protein